MCKIYESCQLFFFPIFSSNVSFSCLLHWLGPKVKVEWKWYFYPFSRQQRDIKTLQVHLSPPDTYAILYICYFCMFQFFLYFKFRKSLLGCFTHLTFIYYYFLAVLCLCGRTQAFSSCGAWTSHCGGFSCCTGSGVCGLQQLWHMGSGVVVHGLGCPVACGIFLDQRSNLRPLHWQVDS